ncbi:hypothetical protein ACFQV2_24930 [Actinokineospora soli]|uniref:Uncharacterized protein n=1 Tax=Actinokineospora soli TaxID=1048753 RepID=A0ABW2TR00_9PSEU
MDEFDPGFLEPIGLGAAEGALYLRLLGSPRAEAGTSPPRWACPRAV